MLIVMAWGDSMKQIRTTLTPACDYSSTILGYPSSDKYCQSIFIQLQIYYNNQVNKIRLITIS